MAAFTINHVRLYGTYAEMIAYTGPKARGNEFLVTDYGIADMGLVYRWNGSAWVLPAYLQKLYGTTTGVSASGTGETTLVTASLPPLRANDSMFVRFGGDMTGSTNNKTWAAKVAATSFWSQAYNNVNHVGLTHDLFFRNRGATNSQVSGHNNANIYGTGPNVLSTSAIQTNVATTFLLTGTKASGGETLTMQFADIWLIGGG
jgi:hypothetical protein